jgi:membrane associated rhomboid family serine protease
MVLIPISDINPVRHIRFQYVTVSLIIACVVAFLWELSRGAQLDYIVCALGTVPGALTGEKNIPCASAIVPPFATLVTAMFLHGDWMHLIGNMAFLWIFGDNVEDALGHFRYLLFYLLCGVGAGLVHVAANLGSTVPAIGASGAISGVLGGYLMLHPRAQVLTLFLRFMVRMPAFVVLGLWIGFQIFSASFESGGEAGGVAWWAHIGGFVIGAILVIFFRRPGVPLLAGLRG